jgi:hypothetical protein
LGWGSWRNISFLCAFYALAIVWGTRSAYFWLASDFDLLVPLTLALALGWWAVADSKARRQPIPMLSRQWFFLGACPLVPGYVIWSRQWAGLGWVVLHTAGWIALASAVSCAGGILLLVLRH